MGISGRWGYIWTLSTVLVVLAPGGRGARADSGTGPQNPGFEVTGRANRESGSGPHAPLRFSHLTVNDGLSNSWVRDILRDYRGFLWIATLGGLDRYDGTGFVHYAPVAGDEHSLASSEVWSLFEDSQHRLWVGAGELALYDRDGDRFVQHPTPRDLTSRTERFIRAIREDREGWLWLATEGEGLLRYNPDSHAVQRYLHDPADPTSLANDDVMALLIDRQDRIWVGTRKGLDRFDPGSDGFVRVLEHATGGEWLAHGRHGPLFVESIYEAADGRLWLGLMGDGLAQYDPQANLVRRWLSDPGDPGSLSGNRVTPVTGDASGAIYAAVENQGLDVLIPGARSFVHYKPDIDDPSSLASASIKSLTFDDQGMLWVGTYNAGLDSVSPLGKPFGLLTARRDGLDNPHVLAVIESADGDLWIGTDGGGLNRLDRATGRFTYYRHDPTDPESLASDAVVSLVEDRQHAIWVGTWNGGLHRLDPRTGRFTRFSRGADLPESFAEWTITQDTDGQFLIGLHGVGVDVFDPNSGTYTRLSTLYPGAGELGEVYAIAVDRTNDLWIGGTAGLEHVDRRSGRVTRYRHAPEDPHSPCPGFVYAIHPDAHGNVWIGTEAGGLACIEAGTGQVRRFTQADGLPDDTVGSILEDEGGDLWLATTRGLAELEDAIEVPQTPRFRTFNVEDGLQGNDFRHGAAFRSPTTGEMFFGGQNGLSFFVPEQVTINSTPPPVTLTDLRIFNRPLEIGAPGSPLRRSISESGDLTLSYKDSVVTFGFAALNFIVPQKNRYAYMLEGFEPDWTHSGRRHTATYTNLPPGHYVFRVRAANNDGVWNEQGVALRLRITPPVWETGWFRLLAGLLAVGIVVGSHRLRVRSINSRARELEARVEDRTQDLARANTALRERTEQLDSLNTVLEARVRARTAEVEAEKERLIVTLRSIGDGVIATDVEGRVVLMNRVAEELTGWEAADAMGHALSEALPIRDRKTREPLQDPVAKVLEKQGVVEIAAECLLVKRNGSEVLIADSAAPIRDRHSRIIGVVLVFRDVTEKRQVEQQLQSAQKLESLGILAGGIAHDFNNLLTGVFGYIDLARNRPGVDTKTLETLSKALAVLSRARGLTSQLLTFSRAGEPVTAPLALGELLQGSAQLALSGSNVSCHTEIAEDLWPCQGDERQIAQVIDNLLLNARQAMPEGGAVGVRADNVVVPRDLRIPVKPGRYVRISIRDRGTGIPVEVRNRVFEPFFTTKLTGTGLGLTTCYSIVSRHHGHIEFTSEVGVGTTFIVYLPAASQPAADTPPPEKLDAGAGRVLVMDDEDYVREVLGEMLTGLGCAVEIVAEGDAAVRACARARESGQSFDVAILDLTIVGGPGGVATLPRLRAIDPDIRAIAASGYSADPVMADPASAGFSATLPKPFTMGEVARVMAKAMGREPEA